MNRTKLAVGLGATTTEPQRLPHDFLYRPALYEKLDRCAPLTVIKGPTGAGKSTLVAAWAERRSVDRALAWLGFASGTRPDRFWSAVHTALTDDADKGESGRGVTEVLAAARRLPGPFVLVLDDLGHVDPAVSEGLARLVREAPQLHLVVCVRGRNALESVAPDVPSTLVINRSDLLVSAGEVAELAERSGVTLAAEEVAEIHLATEGWIGPLRAALQTIGAAPPGRRVPSALADAESFVIRTVLPAETSTVRSALLDPCSVVDGATAELAAALSLAENVQELLSDAEALGLMTAESVDGRQIFRVLPLLRDALAHALAVGAPERYRSVNERAARWYLDDGAPQLAVTHAAEAEQWEMVGDIADSAFVSLITKHPFALRQAMKNMPDQAMADRPRLRAARSVAMAVPGIRGPASASYKQRPAAVPAMSDVESLRDFVALGSAQAVALRTTYEFTASCQVLDQIDAAMGEILEGTSPELDDILPLLQLQWAICRFLAGDMVRATRDFTRAFYGARNAGNDFIARNASAALGLVAAVHGDVPKAAQWLERELEFRLDEVPAADLVHTWGDTARCLHAVEVLDQQLAGDTRPLADDGTRMDELWSVICYAGTQYALLHGEPMAMLNRISSAEQMRVGRRRELGLGGVLLAAAKTDLLVALGHGNRAQQAAWEVDLKHPMLEVSRARMELLTGDLEGARARVADLIWRPETDYRTRLDMLLIGAVAALRQGDEPTALAEAGRALSVADCTGALRPFAWVSRTDLEQLLGRTADGLQLLDRLANLECYDVFPRDVAIVTLSEREQVILEQLVKTGSADEIAENLVVSANTVKSQRRSLYRKLDVKSREQAIETARRLGLLDQHGLRNPTTRLM